MPFTVEEFRDLVRLLEEKPEWRAELRRLVLTEELLSLPGEVARLRAETERRFQELIEAQRRTEDQVAGLTGQVAELAEAQRKTEGQVAELAQAQRKIEGQVAKLTEQVANLTDQVAALTKTVYTLTDAVGELKGESLENRYRERAPAYLARLVRRAHVLSTEELSWLLEEAVEKEKLSEAEAEEILWADLVVQGRKREDGSEVYLVVEVSWGVGSQDVERAVQRAGLLAKAGLSALGVVAGRTVTEEAARLARKMRVWQVTDGRVVPPEPIS